VVAVTDGSHLSRAGRVVMPLAVVLLLCSGNGARPGKTGAPPAQFAVLAPLTLQHGILGHHVLLVQPAARHGQRHRREPATVAALAAALIGAVAATTRRERVSRLRRLNGRILALGQRAPLSWRP
jgi:hypothetical protein